MVLDWSGKRSAARGYRTSFRQSFDVLDACGPVQRSHLRRTVVKLSYAHPAARCASALGSRKMKSTQRLVARAVRPLSA